MEPAAAPSFVECPACGGAGGGPFGPAGSAWDDEEYVCPRCKGEGKVMREDPHASASRLAPGLVKAQPDTALDDEKSAGRKATG
jgi:hypothetical protein